MVRRTCAARTPTGTTAVSDDIAERAELVKAMAQAEVQRKAFEQVARSGERVHRSLTKWAGYTSVDSDSLLRQNESAESAVALIDKA